VKISSTIPHGLSFQIIIKKNIKIIYLTKIYPTIMPTITVLTSSYNRAKTLSRLYESLQKQTSFDFEWLLINDGSTDNTEELVKGFLNNNFEIRYYCQINIGLSASFNKGVELAKGDLIFRVDSDDYITEDAIEQILKNKDRIATNDRLCALVFLSKYSNGDVVGFHPFKINHITNFFDYRYKYHAKGDRAEVVKRSIFLNYPFPKFGNEKFCPEIVMWSKMADKYDALYINSPIYIRDYGLDSITSFGINTLLNNPLGSLERFISVLTRTNSLKYQLIYSINYYRWALNTNLTLGHIFSRVPIISSLLGFIPGVLLHCIDRINPMSISRIKKLLK
jgi:glycosyltransferase involved in cell wall biosynthesis